MEQARRRRTITGSPEQQGILDDDTSDNDKGVKSTGHHWPLRCCVSWMFIAACIYCFGSRQGTAVPTVQSIQSIQSIQTLQTRLFLGDGGPCSEAVVGARLLGPEIRVVPDLKSGVGVDASSLLPGNYRAEVWRRCGDEVSCEVEEDLEVIGGQDSGGKDGKDGGGEWSWKAVKEAGYLFTDQPSSSAIDESKLVTAKNGQLLASKPSSLANHPASNLRYFGDLSNYELVCWLGDDDAERYRQAFLQLYPLMQAAFQRPFKFHYIRLTDITNPTQHFSQVTHQTFDKCKIFFLVYGIQRLENTTHILTPKEFTDEVHTLVRHIENSHPDTTFPIYILTPRSSPHWQCTNNPTPIQPRHPLHMQQINQQLKQHFQNNTNFHPRIRFMDNTNITETLWHSPQQQQQQQDHNNNNNNNNNNNDDNYDILEQRVTTAVAMKCMEQIAIQVKYWRRQLNQRGTRQGLSRNGTLIPNPTTPFVPYPWEPL